MSNSGVPTMASDAVERLTRSDIIRTAENFHWNRSLPKWTVIVERREYPVRPLVTEAAGVAPNDPTNSHEAVKKLNQLEFETRYEGKVTFKPH
jgi:hypothetical protein